jgi:hypothetical protein
MIFLLRLPAVEDVSAWSVLPDIEKKHDASLPSVIGRSDNSFVRVSFVAEFVEMETL